MSNPLDLFYDYKFHFVKEVYLLKMNHIRSSCRSLDTVAWSHSEQALYKFVKSLKVETYEELDPRDQSKNVLYGPGWIKSFKKDSPLEWYNDKYLIVAEDDRAVEYVRSQKNRLGKQTDVYLLSGFWEKESILWNPNEQE